MTTGERIAPADTRPATLTRRQVLTGGLTTVVGGVSLVGLGLAGRPRIGSVPAAASEPIVITVEPDTVVGAVPTRTMGFSFERKALGTPLFSADNEPLVALFQLLGPGVLRIGGNSVETTAWSPDGPGLTTGMVSPADVDRLAAFADAVDWQIIYGTPFISADAADVAAEMALVAPVLGARLAGVELGNEPDLYVLDPTASALAGTYSSFRARWQSVATAVTAAAPGTALAGPATCLLQNIGGWTAPFAHDESEIALVTQHYYRGFFGTGSIDELLGPDPLLASSLSELSTAATGGGIGFRLGETNSYANGGQPGVSNTVASALWGARLVLEAASAGAAGVNLHNSGTGQGYPAIVTVNGTVTEIRPLFYGLLLAARTGSGPLVRTTVGAPSDTLAVWTVRRPDASFGVVVVNVDPDAAFDLTVDFATPVSAALVTALAGPALDATTGTTLAGAEVGIDGSWVPQLAAPTSISGSHVLVHVEAASAVLVDVALASSGTGASSTVTTDASTAAAATPVAAEPRLTG